MRARADGVPAGSVEASSWRVAAIVAGCESRSNGRRPEIISCSRTPTANKSEAGVAAFPRNCSGAM